MVPAVLGSFDSSGLRPGYWVDTSSLGTDKFNDGTPGLEPFVAVTYAGERTFTRYVVNSGVIDHFCSFNIPDSASSIQITVEAWDWDSDNSHDPIKVASTNSTTLTYDPGQSSGWSQWLTLTGTSDPRVTSLRVYAETVTPIRNPVYLVVPSNYEGVYDVTDDGFPEGRRYVGEPRFVALTIQEQFARGPGPVALYLVPRSIFFETKFADLLERQALPDFGLKFSQNGTTSANSDVLQAVFSTRLMPDGISALKALFLQNATGNASFRWIQVDAYLPVLGLPDDAIRFAAYIPFLHSASINYTWDVSTGTKNGWSVWDQIWTGVVAFLDDVLTWIESAIVFVATVADAIVQAIVAFGSWVADLTSGDPARVERAVKAAQQAFDQFVDASLSAIRQAFESVLRPLINLVTEYVDRVMEVMGRALAHARAFWGGDETALPLLTGDLLALVGLIASVFTLLSLAMAAVAITITILSGPIGFAVGLIAGVVQSVILNMVGAALVATGNPLAELLGWLIQGDLLSVMDHVMYDIVGISGSDVPEQGPRSSLETGPALIGLALTIATLVVVFLGSGGMELYEKWISARWGKGGIVGADRHDVFERSSWAGAGLAALFFSALFAFLALSPKPKDQRIGAGAFSIVLGVVAIIAVHSSFPHNRGPMGELLNTRILPPWVRTASDILGVPAIVSSAGAIAATTSEGGST